jgi:hypothetical protein
MNGAITPFALAVPQADLEGLNRRIDQTRWPDAEAVDDWTQGAPLTKVKALVDHWRHRYDWRRCEAMPNDWGQYNTAIDGLDIHFLHVRSKHENALPLIITHGWPGSVIEFMKISIYPRETIRPSRRWVDRWMPNLIHHNILERGGTSPPGNSRPCTPGRFATASPRCADLGKLTRRMRI